MSGTRLAIFLTTLAVGIIMLVAVCMILRRIWVGPPSLEKGDLINVADVIAAVKKELQQAQSRDPATPELPLRSVELDLEVVAVSETSANTKFALVSVGADANFDRKETGSRQQRIKVKLSPPSVSTTQGQTDLAHLGLANAIVNLRAQLRQGMETPPRLTPTDVSIEIAFGVKRTSRTATGLELEVIKVDADSVVEEESKQKIVLKFGKGGDSDEEAAWKD